MLDEMELDAHRTALIGHCYRILGSVVDAEDAVQETMVPAWKGGHQAWAFVVLELEGEAISGWNSFLDVEEWFPRCGLPLRLRRFHTWQSRQ